MRALDTVASDYRAYSVDGNGHIWDVRLIQAHGDSEAWEVATDRITSARIELWCGAREVPQFAPLLLLKSQIVRRKRPNQ